MKANSNTKIIKYLENGFHRNSCWWTNIKILRVSCLPFAGHWITVVTFAWWARPGLILPSDFWNRIWPSYVASDTKFIFTSNHNNLLWFVDDGCHWENEKIIAVVILSVVYGGRGYKYENCWSIIFTLFDKFQIDIVCKVQKYRGVRHNNGE